MKRKITIIGAGSVGASIAYASAIKGIANEICLIDINKEKTLGEAMDIRQGMPFCTACDVYAGEYEDAKGSDIVVITSGVPRKPGQSRIDLTQTNVNIMKDIAGKIAPCAKDALYIIVSNPCDIMTYVFMKMSGIPEHRIIGSGTQLDTSRLVSKIADELDVAPSSVNAFVFGEHGDSSFVPWSIAQIGGVNVLDYENYDIAGNKKVLDTEGIYNYMKTSGSQIIARKGATFYAIALSVCSLMEAIFSGAKTTKVVASMLHGQYGISDVVLSLPFVVGPEGICGYATPKLTSDEVAKLENSAKVLKDVISQVNI